MKINLFKNFCVSVKFDTWNFTVILSLDRYVVSVFKPAKGNSQLNPTPVRDADKAVELCLNIKPSSHCRGEYAEFNPEQQINSRRKKF